MTERPILMSAPMVRAILEGRKTQTRRLVKPSAGLQRTWLTQKSIQRVPHGEIVNGGWQMHHPLAGTIQPYGEVEKDSPLGWIKCPYGVPGDQLWVRETWACLDSKVRPGCRLAFRADSPDGERVRVDAPWKPSIHMPRWASRLTLPVTEVRVERLQDITEADAIAEGVERWVIGEGWREYGLSKADEAVCGPPMPTAKDSYRTLWESLNGAGSWAANPWVWAVSFSAQKAGAQ